MAQNRNLMILGGLALIGGLAIAVASIVKAKKEEGVVITPPGEEEVPVTPPTPPVTPPTPPAPKPLAFDGASWLIDLPASLKIGQVAPRAVASFYTLKTVTSANVGATSPIFGIRVKAADGRTLNLFKDEYTFKTEDVGKTKSVRIEFYLGMFMTPGRVKVELYVVDLYQKTTWITPAWYVTVY